MAIIFRDNHSKTDRLASLSDVPILPWSKSYHPHIDEAAYSAAYRNLTPRQREAFELFKRGYSNGEIANEMVITESAVRQLFSRMYQTFHVTVAYGKQETLRHLIYYFEPVRITQEYQKTLYWTSQVKNPAFFENRTL